MVIWKPQPRQAAFLRRTEPEAFYGGAAGGGKSDCIVAEGLRQVHVPHYRGLILRKTYPQLLDLIDRSRTLYHGAFPRAVYNESGHFWTFPSGAKIYFGSLQHSADKHKYQGKAFQYIAFDELTHFTFDEYIYLFSRNRPNGPGVRCYVRATGNPGGIGHGWVKERFITPAKPMEPITETVRVVAPDGSQIVSERKRVFVPSSVFDNKILMENDPDYVTRLGMLPDAEQRALLYGDWDTFSGQAFMEWRNNPDGYVMRRWTHVIEPFRIPAHWEIYRGFDYGYSKPFAVVWVAVSPDGCLYLMRELYGCTEKADTGIRIPPNEIAARILEIENTDQDLKGREIRGIADPAIWQVTVGESIADMMAKEGVYFDKGDNARLAGKMQYHNRLAFDENGIPALYVFDRCVHFIRTFPTLVYDERKTEDIDTSQEDHLYDAMRYVCMAFPCAREAPKELQTVVFDPLASEKPVGNYDFYLNL